MRRILFIALALLVVVAGLVVWFVQDANRFKPALMAQMARETGIHVEVRGDLAWRFMPRLWLAAEGLHAVHDGRTWSLDWLLVRPDIASLIRNPGGLDQWRIREAVVQDLAIDDPRGLIQAPRIRIRNIGLGDPAYLEAGVLYTPESQARIAHQLPAADADALVLRGRAPSGHLDVLSSTPAPPCGPRDHAGRLLDALATKVGERCGLEPIEVTVAGTLTVETGRFSVRGLRFRMPGAAGSCDLQAMPNGKLWPPPPPVENGILPLGIMRAYDWDGRCDLERIDHGGETIENVLVVLDNKEGASIVTVDAPSFLGGKAQLDAVVGADSSPVTWDVRPVLAGVDSRRLAAWLGGGSLIAAMVDYGGTIRMTGNTSTALAASIVAKTRFSTGAGEIDGTAFAAPLAGLAALSDSGGSATAMPAMFEYESLSGGWTVDGEWHRLDLAVDSLGVEAEGDYLVHDDKLDLRGVIAPGESIEQWGLRLAPALAGMSFHFRCDGSAADPRCRLDVERTLLGAGAAEGSAVARGLIDRHVPEEYRAAACSVLDSLEVQVDAALRKDPEDLIEEHVPEHYQGMARSLLDTLGEALDERNR